ncbi:MAG: sigma-54-dependent Fis family transcriptional regulator [Bacteroidetes bacterium]|nr:MAG: sigma-54-dependent Fis family transcriptional regulator [Bacteroidota bacterium]
MKHGRILVVDDNNSVLSALKLLLQPRYREVITSSSPNQLPHLMGEGRFDVILLDMNFSAGINSGNEGIYWLRRILEIDHTASVIMITAYGDVELAVKAVKEGATNFILKPWDNDKLLATIEASIQRKGRRRTIVKCEEEQGKAAPKRGEQIVGDSPAMKQILEMAEKIAVTDANVLITGENGTGKDLIAQAIHQASLRKQNALVRVDVGALSETLFESELFGHVKGAFTDAKEDRKGKFEVAKGGTLFLDEIANLSLPLQAKLLTALQTREIIRVGSNTKIPVDIRLITATNANLLSCVKEGKFREDLLYRINTIQIEVPALRQRPTDIPLLAEFFLEKYREKYHKPNLSIDKEALQKLTQYPWPGNVRELQHTIEKAVILSDGEKLSCSDFFFSTSSAAASPPPTTLKEMERKMIEECLQRNAYNLSAAATELGITRQTLYNKLKKYQL